MRTWLCAWVILVLTGCATQPAQPYGGNDSNIRQRARIHTELGGGYYAQGQMAIALEEFNEALRIDPNYGLAYNGLGLVYAALGEDAKAEANFKRSLQLDPASSESHNNYGTFLCSRNRIDESVAEFLAALKNPLYPTPEVAWLNAGLCSLKKRDDKNAETYLLNALQVQPGMRQAAYHLASLYHARSEFVQAQHYLQRAMSSGEPSAEMLWLAVHIERALGDRSAESSYALQLKNKYPNSEQARALLSGQ